MIYKNILLRKTLLLIFPVSFLISCSCGNDYIPRPKGYFRIALPEKKYVIFDSVYPYSFEYPAYTKIVPDTNFRAESYWINIEFPRFHGKLHITYKPIKNNLSKYLEDSRMFVNKHIQKAEAIDEKAYTNDEENVYGLIYHIGGSGVASTYQFYITDSTKHFVRGALYFETVPNNDSLSPVIDFIGEDIVHLINTFKWKKVMVK